MKTHNSPLSARIAKSQEASTQAADSEQTGSTRTTFIQPEPAKIEQINARVGAEFRDDVKLYCTLTGMSVQGLVTEAITEYMHNHPRPGVQS